MTFLRKLSCVHVVDFKKMEAVHLSEAELLVLRNKIDGSKDARKYVDNVFTSSANTVGINCANASLTQYQQQKVIH